MLQITTKATLNRLRDLREDAKIANQKVATHKQVLFDLTIAEADKMYVEHKAEFKSYNAFIKAYKAELLSVVNDTEISLISTVDLVCFAMEKSIKKIDFSKLSKVHKLKAFINFKDLKSDKSTASVIAEAQEKQDDLIIANNAKFIAALEGRDLSELEQLSAAMKIMVKRAKKAKK